MHDVKMKDRQITLTEEQEQAVQAIYACRDRFALLTGLAGTGKTTCMEALCRRFDADPNVGEVHLCAPTGKAASVLAKKTGRPAMTLHSLMYAAAYEKEVVDPETGKTSQKLTFQGDRKLVGVSDVVIVDEASMVGTRLHRDLDERVPPGARIVYVGDHGQLSPVKDSWGPDFQRPTASLVTVHRQAAGNPIVQAAHAVRERNMPPVHDAPDGRYRYMQVSPGIVARAFAERIKREKDPATVDSVVITFTRKARSSINTMVRHCLDYPKHAVQVGEPLRVASTNYRHGARNGEILRVVDPGEATRFAGGVHIIQGLQVQRPTGQIITCSTGPIGLDRKDYGNVLRNVVNTRRPAQSDYVHFDHGYAITCHAAQGSEWTTVGVYAEDVMFRVYGRQGRRDEIGRWFYTAVTRARESVFIFAG